MKCRCSIFGIALTALLGLAASAQAGSVLLGSYSQTGADGREARADFYNTNGKLEIDVNNTGDATKVADGSHVLTSFFFNLAGSPSLGYSSAKSLATITGFSGDSNTPSLGGGSNEKSNWVLSSALPSGYSYGVGTPGGANFGGGIQGVSNGILPLGAKFPVLNGDTQSQVPFATPVISFFFCLPEGYSLTADSILGASFGYGSASSGAAARPSVDVDPGATAVPLPAAAWSGLGMLGGLAVIARIRKSRAS